MQKIISVWLASAVLVALAGCSRSDEFSRSGPSASGGPQSPSSAADSAAALDPANFEDGATSVAVDGKLVFHTSRLYGANLRAHLDDLGRAVHLTGVSQRMSVPLSVEILDPKDPGSPLLDVVVRLSAPLLADQWYEISVDSTALAFVDGANDGTWSAQFFTGSAPRILRASLSAKENMLHLFFSESVDVATVPQSVLRVNGASVSQCVVVGGNCVGSDSVVANVADVELSQPVDVKAVKAGSAIVEIGRAHV